MSIIAVVLVIAALIGMSARHQWRALRSLPKPQWNVTEVALICVAVVVCRRGRWRRRRLPSARRSRPFGPCELGARCGRDGDRCGLPVHRAGCLSAPDLADVAAVSEVAFDELIHAPLRLQICAMLAPVQSLPFADVRDHLGISDSVLSKHLSALAGAGYVEVSRVRKDSRSRRQLTLTEPGRTALHGHLAALQAIAAAAEPQPSRRSRPLPWPWTVARPAKVARPVRRSPSTREARRQRVAANP